MRLATFNILHGRTVGDGVDPARLRQCIETLNPDVLALQEVDCDQERSGRSDLTSIAAEAMGALAYRFVAAIAGTPGATWMAATGAEAPGTAGYGVSLLSRYPAQMWQVIRLPRIPVRFPIYLPDAKVMTIVDEEPRVAVVGQLETPLGSMTVANTHLSFVPGWNRWQLRRLVRDLAGFTAPRLLLGDLNLVPPAVRRSTALRSLAQGLTFPADQPERQLDHILTDDPGLRATSVEAPQMAISDHRPLVVDVERAAFS